MNDKEEFRIILWSTENIRIDGTSLDEIIGYEAPSVNVKIVAKLAQLKDMKLKKYNKFLDTVSEKSALIISSKEKLDDIDLWKLGFAMGKMSYKIKGKIPAIAFVKGDKTSFFEELSELCSETCENVDDLKTELKVLMNEFGIKGITIDATDFTSAKKVAGKERRI